MLKIGEIALATMPLILAPMEDISDPPFRAICRQLGADLVYSEFISSEGLIRDAEKSKIKLDIYDEERPVALQLFGHDSSSMIEAVKLAEEVNPDIIDLNYGCPVKKVVRKGAGAALLKDTDRMLELTKLIVNSTNKAVTVKTRLGWDHRSIQITELCEKLQDCGVKAIALHARTAVQMYSGQADWSWFPKIKNNPRFTIPLFGNGDVKTPADAMRMKNDYAVDGIMIGRGSVGNPWIFRDIKGFFLTGKSPDPPTIEERIHICRKHLYDSIKWKGERIAIFEMRKHYAAYFKSIPDIKALRIKLCESNSINEIEYLLEKVYSIYQA